MKLNQPLTYQELCSELQIEPDKRNVMRHIKHLQESYDIEIISEGGKRNSYIIREEYDDEMRAFIQSLNAPIQQLRFEAKLFEACLHNPDRVLILSNTQLLRTLSEVNDNFSFTFDWAALNKIDDELSYMSNMTKTVYKILYQWTMRKLDSMDKRMLFIKRRCFRLYKTIPVEGGSVIQTIDVPVNSETEAKCQAIWNGVVDQIDSKYKDERGELLWMPEGIWGRFEREIDRRVMEYGYSGMRRVIMLSPPSKEYMVERLEHHYQAIKGLEEIQKKAQEKVLTTSQLDQYSREQREEYIKYNMTDKPPYWFRERATKNINKEQGT